MPAAPTQHAHLIAFSPPSVKGSAVVLPVRFAGRDTTTVEIAMPLPLAESLRDALRRAVPATRANSRAASRSARFAAYRRVVAAVNAGAKWVAAAAAENLQPGHVRAWWHYQQKRAARQKRGGFIRKPSGALI